MRAVIRRIWIGLIAASVCLGSPATQAADPEVSISLVPMRQVVIDGDRGKFRAHHWMKDGYVGGIKDASMHYESPGGTVFSAEGHALIDENDLGGELSLEREGLGFFQLEYDEFRKYYDNTGGSHRLFGTLQSNDTFRDLALDIGRFGVKTGLTFEGWPELGFEYEREFKDGTKSRLTWATVKDPAARKIAPAWQDLDEIVDTFAIDASHEVAGFRLGGEQRWEFVRSEAFREEKALATTGAAADTTITRQDQAPEATLMTTMLNGERQFLGEKALVASAYRFAHMDSREFENILQRNANDTPAGTHNRYNARADNDYDSHTWVQHFSLVPWPWLSVGSQLKAELIRREGNSTYPSDTTNPADGIVNTTEVSLANNKATRWGEGVSLRFKGIPRTALYTELELEQARVLMREDRQSRAGQSASNANETFNRETVTDVRRGAWTLGGRMDPWPFLDLTAHVRRRVNDSDYDDQRESVASGTALSAFIDMQNVHTNEFVTRVTLRPCRWFRSSVRYQFRDDDYSTRFEAQDTVKAGTTSHIYTYDVTLQPLRELTTTTSFSRQTAATTTPAALASVNPGGGLPRYNIPTFNADVNTWLLSADYTPVPRVTLMGSLLYSLADNFDDFADRGLPYGADFRRLDLTAGVKWSVSDGTSIGTEYALYRYNPHENVESGDYTAHVIWLEVSQAF